MNKDTTCDGQKRDAQQEEEVEPDQLRSYALEQLATQGEEATVRQAHATHYLALADLRSTVWR